MPIRLSEHDSSWITSAELLMNDLSKFLGDCVSRIDHVGSTAIPGIAAKPKLHIDVILKANIEPAPVCSRLTDLGYLNLGYLHSDGEVQLTRQTGSGFSPSTADREIRHMAHRLCVCRADCPTPSERRRFRDALIANFALAQDYEALKQELAATVGLSDNWQEYNSGKSAFIEQVLSANPIETQNTKTPATGKPDAG